MTWGFEVSDKEAVLLSRDLFQRDKKAFFIIWIVSLFFPLLEFGLSISFVKCASLAFFLSWVAVFDARYGLIFNKWLVCMALCALMFLLAGGISPYNLLYVLAYSFAASALVWGIRFVSRGGIGLGDVKFVFVLGLWLSPAGLLIALLISFWVGGSFALMAVLLGNMPASASIPFGPFLSLGAFAASVYGEGIAAFYSGLFL